MPNPTIVSASLDDKELQQSIANLVAHVKRGLHTMLTDTNSTVDAMEKKLKSLGSLKIDTGGSNDGGASKRAKAQNAETDAVEKNIAARDKQIKKNQEVATSFDQMAKAQQVAIRSASPSGIRNADTLQTMNIQLDLLRERLREARQQYSSFVALAAHATTTGDKGLFQYATDGVHRYEQEVRNLIPQIRTLQSGIQQMGDVIAPQGHTIQNYVNSLQKANPELAQLNAQYKSGQSLLQGNTVATERYTEAIQRQAQAIRESKQWQEKGWVVVGNQRYYDKERVNATPRERQLLLSLEEQIVQAQQKEAQEALAAAEAKRQQAQAAKEAANTIKSVSYKTDLQMSLSGFGVTHTQDVTNEQVKQYQTLEEQLQKLKTSYASMNEEAKKSEQGLGISKSIFELQRQRTELLQSIAQQMSKKQTSAATDQFSSLRQSISSVLGVQSENVRLFDAEKASSEQLSKELKMLQSAYSKLSASRIAKGDGTAIADEIQRVQRALQKLQAKQTRPTSLKSVMGLDEKTLDDIAYKMRQLSSYRSGLNVATQTKEITQVNDEYNRLNKRMDEVMQKNQQMIASNTALGRSWNYMKNRLAFYFTVGASTQFIKNLIEVRSQYEMNERALGILVNSAERGTQIFNELSQMALVSPYTLIELSAAAKQLTAYDVAAKDVVDTTRRLADMAAAVGIPIERLTYALGQIKAYGYLNARDARMFANAGIPLVKQLSEYYTELEGRLVSTADIYDRIKKKSIGYEEVTSVIAKMTDEGGKFYDFQAKMAETLKVQLANLTLAWNNMLNAMGEESQGVLVGSISTLKQVFLHWKDIEHVLYELVVALGAYKAYQIITTRLMGETAASLDAQVLAMKRNKAAMLEKQALTRKLTADEISQVNAQKMVTAADYQNALSGKQLTKQKALLLVALNKNNVQLKTAIVNMGLLTTQEVANITAGKALAIVFKSIWISIKSAASAAKAFMASMWPLLVVGAIYELYHAWDSYEEHVKEINKQAAEHAKEAFDNIRQYLESDVTSALQDRLAKGGKVESDAAGQKAWDEMREKIELSSSASNAFIAKLMQINDINERLSAGFGYLEDVQKVAGVMQTLEEDAVNISSTTLGGLFGEGLKDDLADFINAYQKYVSLNENLRQSGVGEEYFNDQKRALEEFRGEVEKTTTSLYNVASKEGFNTNEQREFFEREISEIAQAEQMGAKETRIFRMQAEKEYYAYARAQLVSQLEYQDGAQKALTQKRINDLDNEFGTSKAMQESFFTWLTEKQDHAVKNMLRGKTQEEIKQGEWLKGSNAKWVEEMARKFSKEYGVSFDDLHRLVLNANTWSINIPVFFQTIGQPLSDVQRDYEARTGKKFSSNALIKDAKTQVDIIDTLKKKQKEVANEMETARKAGGKYWEDNKQRYKEENDALVADIHAYNALTDAEEKANKKRGKGGSKKDPLLDALKQEISLVEKLQSDYDKLSKSGASQAEALETIRGAYGKTIRLLNAQLGRYGLPQIDISQMITGKDPNKALAHFKQTLDTLVRKGMLTLERSKELEAVVEKFTLSAKTYNLDMITKGLNNELGKLKDEYELAVAIDADPELGNAFADMMGINAESLPHTVKEYADEYSKYLNKYLKGKKSEMQLTGDELRGLTRDDINALQSQVDAGTFNQEWFDAIKKAYDDISGKRKKDLEETEKWKNGLIEKYGNLQDKLTKIYKDSVQNQVNAVKTFGTEDQKSDIVRLQLRLEATDNPAELTEINTEIAKIVKDVTDKNPIALKLVTASENQTKADTSKAYWEDFKNKDELYAMTFEDMANNSTRAIQLIMDKLEGLKDKVKEDPVSMKALMKSLEDAEKELNTRDPFGGVARSLRDMANASQETKAAQEALWQAEVDVEQAQQEVDNAEDGTPEEQAVAQQKLTDAIQRRAAAQVKLTQAENQGKKAQENLKSSLQGISNQLGNVQELFGVVSKLFRAGGDDETADAIDAISEGFSIMTTVIMGVVAAMVLLESSQPWLLAIAAALSVIVGLVSFLSGQDNKRIDAEIKDSELAVKRLELAYIDLEHAINNAYGMTTIGAQKAAIANKELQLVELKRQLALEKSRDSKDRDEDRIVELQKQIKELEYDIKDATDAIVNDLLGISSVGDALEGFMDNIIEHFRDGSYQLKNIMGDWNESINDMIANMVKKMYTTKILEPWFESVWQGIQDNIDKRMNGFARFAGVMMENDWKQFDYMSWLYEKEGRTPEELVKHYSDALGGFSQEVMDMLDFSSFDALKSSILRVYKSGGLMSEDIKAYAEALRSGEPVISENMEDLENLLRELGLINDKKETSLSLLQQGIQGITEDTAGALEAYMNGVSQQVYLHSDLLTQIRDAVVGIDIDVQVATQAQMLLQLQQSYAVQMAIQGILEGWNNPSGQAVRVELVS